MDRMIACRPQAYALCARPVLQNYKIVDDLCGLLTNKNLGGKRAARNPGATRDNRNALPPELPPRVARFALYPGYKS
jgi:hypothetical protein